MFNIILINKIYEVCNLNRVTRSTTVHPLQPAARLSSVLSQTVRFIHGLRHCKVVIDDHLFIYSLCIEFESICRYPGARCSNLNVPHLNDFITCFKYDMLQYNVLI